MMTLESYSVNDILCPFEQFLNEYCVIRNPQEYLLMTASITTRRNDPRVPSNQL